MRQGFKCCLFVGKCQRDVVTLTNRTGFIETPLYPKRYKNRQTCVWHIRVKPGYRVKLTIKQSAFGIGTETNNKNCLAKDYMVVSSRSQGFSDYRFAKRFHFSISFTYRRVAYRRATASFRLFS